ncbi:NUDIX hydrolase [Candidatus Microgenomates bacterium]|nr:NUDIX hydrolase [Candidatus Microgenomates bacterium]
MSKKRGKWKRISSELIFDKRIRIIEHKVILPTGEDSSYIVDHDVKGAIATLISPKEGYVLLTYQYRFPLDKWIYDLPGGGIREKETLREAAIRECKEEVGLIPKRLIHLATFYTNPARTDWPMNIFFASEFEGRTHIENEPGEVVKKVFMQTKKLETLIKNKKIVDPSTIIAFTCARIHGLI